ncbi:hypothetical protein QR680_004575 [Steinernema hermaphroditum]|uniref:Uncharacterized protein n=1 Tax=Steinernema hermaphroditum TaxID=289476 RepID=A0AA39HRF6_9BILA|nr:hypothetical protein QR680_004575 [Steinernema hermaphroditum]
MNSIPFAFCDAVASILRDFEKLHNFSDSADNSLWAFVLGEHITKRVSLTLEIRYADGEWRYRIFRTNNFEERYFRGKTLKVEDVVKMAKKKSKYLQISKIEVHLTRFTQQSTVIYDVHRIFDLVKYFANEPDLVIGSIETGEHELADLLSYLECISFRSMELRQPHPLCEQFVKGQLRRNCSHLRSVDFRCTDRCSISWSRELVDALKRCMIEESKWCGVQYSRLVDG